MEFSTTQYSVARFRDLYQDGSLIIKPPFQRKPVWLPRQKCYLIESVLLRIPVPEVYIQIITDSEGKQTSAVVDGQQRIRTLLQFIGVDKDEDELEHNKFVLDTLPATSPFKDKTFASLKPEQRQAFFEYEFAVRLLKTTSDDAVRDVFKRLNKFLTPLNEPELRNATYTGPFVKVVETLAEPDYWIENKIVTKAQIRRMKDLEFVSELLIGVMHGPQSGSPAAVTDYYAQYEEYEEFPDQKKSTKLFRDALAVVQKVLPDIEGTRWSNISDFYSLFVAVGTLLRTHKLSMAQVPKLKRALDRFERQVDLYRQDEDATVPKAVKDYVEAVERGANDKQRRAARHIALLEVIGPHFTER